MKLKFKKKNTIKNQALFKKGGYSILITALVLAALILLNWFLSVMSTRVNLEIDMTKEKKSSISEENIDYIKGVKNGVTVTVVANKDEYESAMDYYSQNLYHAYATENYFGQTLTLIDKYAAYNDKISIEYVDPYSNDFSKITQTYPSLNISYGDIIVSCKLEGNERVKLVSFTDIYSLTQDSTYASYGYETYNISGNNIETALTSAIAYVTSADSKKLALITGHSSYDYTENYQQVLSDNNYEISIIDSKLVKEISKDFDAVAILSPSIDFTAEEISAISEFLDNDGKLEKGLLFFADSSCPALPNLYTYLAQWGINIGEGVLYETTGQYHIESDKTSMLSQPASLEDDDIMSQIETYALTGFNVPMTTGKPSENTCEVTALVQTASPEVVIAPVGSTKDFTEYTEADKQRYDTIIQAVDSRYDDSNNEIKSYVVAFSSVEFIESDWAFAQTSNIDMVLNCTDRVCNVGDVGIRFTPKTLTNETFYQSVTETKTKAMRWIFMIGVPIIMIGVGVFIYVRRRNAQ